MDVAIVRKYREFDKEKEPSEGECIRGIRRSFTNQDHEENN